MGKGKTLRSDLRNVVLKVMTYFENEKKNRSYIIPVDQAMKRTAMATGISERTLRNIKQEVKKVASASSEAGANDWKREINHVDRLRQQYWESDRLQELNERELIISLGTDSESDTDSIFSDSESEISGVESMDVSD
ncbi:unnamed protein product, partial [Brenthis ino]